MYYIYSSRNTFSIDSNLVVNHIWICSCVFHTASSAVLLVGSGIPQNGVIPLCGGQNGLTKPLQSYTLCGGKKDSPNIYKPPTRPPEIKTDSPSPYNAITHFEIAKKDFLNFYKPLSLFEID